MIKGIFFDIGGTLCHGENINHKLSFKKILANITGRNLEDFQVLKQPYLWTSAASKRQLVLQLCKDLKIDNWQHVYNELEKISYRINLYNDVIPCLKMLSSFHLGILSNTTIWTAHDHTMLGLDEYIDISVLSCNVGFAKPDKRIFDYAQRKIELKAEELLYIGDTIKYDVEPALKANWNAALLSRSTKKQEHLDVPMFCNLLELRQYLSNVGS